MGRAAQQRRPTIQEDGHILGGNWEWHSLCSAGQSGAASGGALKYGAAPAEVTQFLPASPRATTAVGSIRPFKRAQSGLPVSG